MTRDFFVRQGIFSTESCRIPRKNNAVWRKKLRQLGVLSIIKQALMSIITDFLKKVYNKLIDLQDANNFILYAKSLNNDDEGCDEDIDDEDEKCFGLFM